MKKLSLVFVLVFALIAFSGLVAAQADVTDVKVNGIDVGLDVLTGLGTNTVYIERGEDVVVEVFVIGEDDGDNAVVSDYEDVKIEVELNGYDHGDIETSKEFNIREGTYGKSVLRLEVPQDMDANEDYELTVSVEGQTEATLTLRVEEKPHLLSIYDAIIAPNEVEAGKPVFVSVLVENMGSNEEERATISVSVPALGVETVKFLEELESVDTNDREKDDNDQIVDLALEIPKSAVAGEYELVVRITYDRGHTETEKSYTIVVSGEAEAVANVVTEALIANVDVQSQSVAQGEGVIYTLSLANLASEAKTYTFAVEGVNFGSVRVDPQTVTLNKDETKVVLVYVSPAENAVAGAKTFAVKVMEGSSVVKEFALTANVVESESDASYSAVRKVLEIGFIVLLIVLVILGIVVVAKKLASDDDEDAGIEGQTYY